MAEMQKMKKIGFRPRPIRKNQKNCISATADLQKVAYSYWRLSKRSKQVDCNIS